MMVIGQVQLLNVFVLIFSLLSSGIYPVSAEGLFETSQSELSDISSDQSGNRTTPSVGFNGFLRSGIFLGKAPKGDGAELKSATTESSLKLNLQSGSKWSGNVDLRLAAIARDDDQHNEIKLREGYLNGRFGDFDFSLGKKIIVWGRADGFSPTDNISPADYSLHTAEDDERRLANLLAETVWYLGPISLMAILLPVYQPSHFPRFDLGSPIVLDDPRYPGFSLKNGGAAAKIDYRSAAFEASLSHFYGFAPLAGIEFKEISFSGGQAEIHVGMRAFRENVSGFDFSTAIGSLFGLRGEAALRRPLDYSLRDYAPLPDFRYIIGVDKEVIQDVTVIIQYAGQYVLGWQPPGEQEPDSFLSDQGMSEQAEQMNRILAGQQQEISHTLSLNLAINLFYETLKISQFSMFNATTEELMVKAILEYDLGDGVQGFFGGVLYHGPNGTLFDLVEEYQSEVFVDLKLSF